MNDSRDNQFHFGTKAETLSMLAPLLKSAKICQIFYFTVERWQRDQAEVLAEIYTTIKEKKLVVRSSSKSEDLSEGSMAGAFHSILDVSLDDKAQLIRSVEDVIKSYSGNLKDQVLIQPMISDVAVSGVITTRVLDDGAPYYVLNYDDESGRTDTITGGVGANKTVLIHRSASRLMISSARVARWFEMIRELEFICQNIPLDIEFGETKQGDLYLFQVRQIAADKKWKKDVAGLISDTQEFIETFLEVRSQQRPGLAGARTILGEMPDWNPAEMIGTSPRPLAVSLYRNLITDETWRVARSKMGYKHPRFECLMTVIGGKPYIDVRNSFNSFLPAGLSDSLENKIVNAWLKRLETSPELHDKVEFEIASTAMDFSFDQNFKKRYPNLLSENEFNEYRQQLVTLTQRCTDMSDAGSLAQALNTIEQLEKAQLARLTGSKALKRPSDLLVSIYQLLLECKDKGTLPFSIIARHAFIAESLLISAQTRGALTEERVLDFKKSLTSVSGDFSNAFSVAFKDLSSRRDFLVKFGHLRPGTYDILSQRYDQRSDLFDHCLLPPTELKSNQFYFSQAETDSLTRLLKEIGLDHMSPIKLLEYCSRSILGREHAKFIFTRNLSQAIEELAEWGQHLNLSRADISCLKIDDILSTLTSPVLMSPERHFKNLADDGRKKMEITRSLHLGYLIRNRADLFVVPLHRAAPNFVTHKHIEGEVVLVDSNTPSNVNLNKKIVCIENADPGFDWIFTRGISALITKFGGKNSHMAIRCAEFGLPAAIGCGEQTFERLVRAQMIELNCSGKVVKPLYS